jgi:hypothetical protein
MRLSAIHLLDRDELERLRPRAGDVVDYQGTRYVVTQVGLKYCHMHLESNQRITGFAKLRDVSKWFPPSPEEMEDHESKTLLIGEGQ